MSLRNIIFVIEDGDWATGDIFFVRKEDVLRWYKMRNYAGLSDRELIILLHQDDKDALRPLYDRHLRPLHYFILRIAKSKHLAEDIVQDVFLKIWETRYQIDEEQSFKSYLYTMAKNHLLNMLKRMQNEKFILTEIKKYTAPAEKTTDLDLAYTETNEILQEAIEKLPPQCKAVFVRCKIDGMAYKEVAAELGITEGTVHSQMVKALRIIKEYINLKNSLLLLLMCIEKYLTV